MPNRASRALTPGGQYSRLAAVFLESVLAFALVLGHVAPARAEEPPLPTPPPISAHYIQYGVALTSEAVMTRAPDCGASAELGCILDDGAGLALRVGYRSRGAWYFGGAYEFSRQDSSNLLRLAILQQLRLESRYHLSRFTRLSPYLAGALGFVVYGNEWGVDTWGAGLTLGAGMEFQVTPTILFDVSLNYRPHLLRNWTESGLPVRGDGVSGFGFVQLFSIEVGVDIKEALARW